MSSAVTHCLRIAAVVLLDQLTKLAAHSIWRSSPLVVVKRFMCFGYCENTGAAWSMFRGSSSLLATVGIVAMAALIVFRKIFDSPCKQFAAALIFGGVCGNSIDRIFRGHVIDFIGIDLKFYRWPTFNVADGAIFIGTVILLFTFHRKMQEAG
ncbi:MAG: signal peptidase II [Puniceicoccales bacterium]|jgi:signal peptidase II|nr:signal peptidase II [Puniceicoccales bacterium]